MKYSQTTIRAKTVFVVAKSSLVSFVSNFLSLCGLTVVTSQIGQLLTKITFWKGCCNSTMLDHSKTINYQQCWELKYCLCEVNISFEINFEKKRYKLLKFIDWKQVSMSVKQPNENLYSNSIRPRLVISLCRYFFDPKSDANGRHVNREVN